MRTQDPETGYIGQTWLGKDYGADVRCRRCGGRGMWHRGEEFDPETVLCLRCADEWHLMAGDLFDKHGWKDMRSNLKKWMAAFDEFCQTKPKELDVKAHNRQIKSNDRVIHAMFPQYFS